MTTEAPFNVLFVCTGNVCRSAFAELLCRQLFNDRLGPEAWGTVAVSSAGLRAVVGVGMHPYTRDVLALWGPSLYEESDMFVARPLRDHMVRWADLILTAEDGQREEIASTAPDAMPKLFTMLRFARIVRTLPSVALPPEPVLRARTAVIAAAGSTEPARHGDAIPDPIGLSPQEHLRAADLIFEAVGAFVDAVAPRHDRRANGGRR